MNHSSVACGRCAIMIEGPDRNLGGWCFLAAVLTLLSARSYYAGLYYVFFCVFYSEIRDFTRASSRNGMVANTLQHFAAPLFRVATTFCWKRNAVLVLGTLLFLGYAGAHLPPDAGNHQEIKGCIACIWRMTHGLDQLSGDTRPQPVEWWHTVSAITSIVIWMPVEVAPYWSFLLFFWIFRNM